MSNFSAAPALLAFRALVSTAPYLSTVVIGVPEAIPPTLMAWVTVGGYGPVHVSRHGSILVVSVELHCWLGYLIQDDAAEAEILLARRVPDMMARLERNGYEAVDDVGRNLNGTCSRMELQSLNHLATYTAHLGSEIRAYPISVLVALDAEA